MGYDLRLRSGIFLEPNKRQWPAADWVFFQSPKSAHLLHMVPHVVSFLKDAKIAAIAPSTAQVLQQMGIHVDFTGDSSNTKKTGEMFAAQLKKNEQVLLLSGNQSVQTIKRSLPKRSCLEINWYRNIVTQNNFEEKFHFAHCSSPSQVQGLESYLQQNKECQIIAMGSSTARYANAIGLSPIFPREFSEEALLETIQDIVASK